MPFFHLRLSALHSTLNQVQLIGYVVQPTGFLSKTEHWSCHLPVLRNWSPLVVFFSPLPRLCTLRAMHIGVDFAETCDLVDVCHSMLSMSSYDKQSLSKEGQLDHDSDAPVSISDEEKERQRRKRIGLANKGRIPWNKGKKHTSETCERIKQRTIEALKDPQVRKKMSEHPHPHSEESKAKMRSTLKRIWGQRLKLKRLKEKFFLSWIESIAEAAKKGGSGQQELYWDSFENILQELNLQQLQQAAEKEKAKAMEATKKREKKAGKAKAKEMVRLARERKKDEDIRENDEELTIIQGLKRRQRLEKLDRKTSTNGEGATRGEIVMSHISAFEKLDLKLVKTEKMRKVVSFADQIRAAKNKKMELAIAASTSAHAANEKPGEYV